MKLHSLKLENFQGIRAAEFCFDGKNATIYGDNATGKTTVFNAVTWLLFDKASTGAKGFTPKTKSSDGDVHNLNHSATAVFILEDGRTLTLCKTFTEVYKKKKGSPISEFSGHTTLYFVNGVPSKEKEYQSAISDVCDSEQLKILTMPHYFSEGMTWDGRRKLLLEVCGEINDDDILDSTPELKELRNLLKIPGTTDKSYSIDEFKKVAGPLKTAINKELEEIPSRIDEASRSLEDISDITMNDVDAKMKTANAELERLNKKYADHLQGDDGAAEITKQLADEKVKLEELKGEYLRKSVELGAAHASKISAIKRNMSEITSLISIKDAERTQKSAELSRITSMREKLISEYTEIQTKKFDVSKTVCPTCGREYPPEHINQMIEKFNINKSEKLAELNKIGKETASKDIIERLKADIGLLDKEIETEQSKLTEFKNNLDNSLKEYELIQPPSFETTDTYKVITAKINELSAAQNNARSYRSEQYKCIVEKINDVRKQINAFKSIELKLQSTEKTRDRIKELEDREQELAKNYEELEKTLYLCDLFTKEKVSRLTDKINDKFSTVSFKLFNEQINGGIKEDCEVLIPTPDGRMVPYSYANNAARINAGLEIIGVLSEYWNKSIPVFIDNAESVTRLIDTSTQTIKLVVSEKDKKLRLEVDDT